MKQEDRERLIRIEEQNKIIFKNLKDIKINLFGNGQEGLIKIVKGQGTTISNIKFALTIFVPTIVILIGLIKIL